MFWKEKCRKHIIAALYDRFSYLESFWSWGGGGGGKDVVPTVFCFLVEQIVSFII